MNTLWKYMLVSASLLAVIAAAGVIPMAWLYDATAAQIEHNLQQARLHNINAVLDPALYDNDILQQTEQVQDATLTPGQRTATLYYAKRNATPVATLYEVVAPDGYSGDIRLLVGVLRDGRISGVRILEHKETPGLGDAIDQYHSDYLEVFGGKSLGQPPSARWKVKRDGGDFDQLTGATITPRAVVAAVHRVLMYHKAQQNSTTAIVTE